MRWLLLGLAGCVGGSATTKEDTATDPSTGSDAPHTLTTIVIQTGPVCVFELGLWCFEDYGHGGAPSQTTGTCPTLDIPSLLAQDATLEHDRCVGGSGYDLVTGWYRSEYFFDASGALAAVTFSTDTNSMCNANSSVAYGENPYCPERCVVDDPNGVSGLPPC